MEETMELFNYYSLDECLNRKQVLNILKSFKSKGKIEYTLDQEILKIRDLDLEEDVIKDANGKTLIKVTLENSPGWVKGTYKDGKFYPPKETINE